MSLKWKEWMFSFIHKWFWEPLSILLYLVNCVQHCNSKQISFIYVDYLCYTLMIVLHSHFRPAKMFINLVFCTVVLKWICQTLLWFLIEKFIILAQFWEISFLLLVYLLWDFLYCVNGCFGSFIVDLIQYFYGLSKLFTDEESFKEFL